MHPIQLPASGCANLHYPISLEEVAIKKKANMQMRMCTINNPLRAMFIVYRVAKKPEEIFDALKLIK